MSSRLLRSACPCQLMAGSLFNIWLNSTHVETLLICCMPACMRIEATLCNRHSVKWSFAGPAPNITQYMAAEMVARQVLPNNCSTLHCIPLLPCYRRLKQG